MNYWLNDSLKITELYVPNFYRLDPNSGTWTEPELKFEKGGYCFSIGNDNLQTIDDVCDGGLVGVIIEQIETMGWRQPIYEKGSETGDFHRCQILSDAEKKEIAEKVSKFCMG